MPFFFFGKLDFVRRNNFCFACSVLFFFPCVCMFVHSDFFLPWLVDKFAYFFSVPLLFFFFLNEVINAF